MEVLFYLILLSNLKLFFSRLLYDIIDVKRGSENEFGTYKKDRSGDCGAD